MSYLGIYSTSMAIGFIFDKILFCIPPHFNRRGIQTIIYTRITTKIVYDIFCFLLYAIYPPRCIVSRSQKSQFNFLLNFLN